MVLALAHRHLGEHHQNRYAQVVQGANEGAFDLFEPAVHSAHAVPGHVNLFGHRLGTHLLDVLGDLFDQLAVVASDLETAGVDQPQRATGVEVQVGVERDRVADAGGGHRLAEDRVDQGGLAHAGLAEDGEVEPSELRGLLLEL